MKILVKNGDDALPLQKYYSRRKLYLYDIFVHTLSIRFEKKVTIIISNFISKK